MHDIIQNQVKAFIDLRSNYDDIKKLSAIYPLLSEELLQNNIDIISKRDTTSEFIKQLPKGYVELSCPVTNTLAQSQHSLPLGEANALYFKGEEPFYVLQENFCVEAFYYPETSVFILLRGCLDYEKKLQRLLTLLKDKGSKLESYYQQPTKFNGFYCFHQSPYHYYYFKVSHLIPTLENVDGLNDVSVYSLVGKSYLDLSQISRKVIKDVTLKKMFTIEDNLHHGHFYMCVGEHRRKLSDQQAEECDISVRKNLINKEFKNEKLDKLKKLKQTHFILWLGISSGKRTWIEQITSYKKLITESVNTIGNIVVVIDGWTRAKSSNTDIPLYSGDKDLADELISFFTGNPNVKFFDMIGEDAEIKARTSLDVDFFVANHATGSIWVSRIAGAKGITHISNIARESAISQHIHPHAQLIPTEYISDIESEDAQTPFHVSYSIPTDQFMKIALPIILDIYFNKERRQEKNKFFNRLKLTDKSKAAEILRDLALVFDDLGDRKMAFKLMYKALEQRPNGPFIQQKVKEWKLNL